MLLCILTKLRMMYFFHIFQNTVWNTDACESAHSIAKAAINAITRLVVKGTNLPILQLFLSFVQEKILEIVYSDNKHCFWNQRLMSANAHLSTAFGGSLLKMNKVFAKVRKMDAKDQCVFYHSDGHCRIAWIQCDWKIWIVPIRKRSTPSYSIFRTVCVFYWISTLSLCSPHVTRVIFFRVY